MNNPDLERRIDQSLRQSHYRPWHRRFWGRVTLIGGAIVMIFIAAYLYLTVQYVRDLQGFDITKTIAELQNDSIFNTLVTTDDPHLGASEPKVIIVAFEDFQCPYCLEAEPIVKEMLAKYKDDVLFIYRDFPLKSIHPEAESAALAANCADDQGKFWEFHDELFARQSELSDSTYRRIAETLALDISQFNICYNTQKYQSEINADIEAGKALGVIGTPTFFVNGQIFPGVLPIEWWDTVLPLLLDQQ